MKRLIFSSLATLSLLATATPVAAYGYRYVPHGGGSSNNYNYNQNQNQNINVGVTVNVNAHPSQQQNPHHGGSTSPVSFDYNRYPYQGPRTRNSFIYYTPSIPFQTQPSYGCRYCYRPPVDYSHRYPAKYVNPNRGYKPYYSGRYY